MRKKKLDYALRLNKRKIDEENKKIPYRQLIKQLEQSSLCLRNEKYLSSEISVENNEDHDLNSLLDVSTGSRKSKSLDILNNSALLLKSNLKKKEEVDDYNYPQTTSSYKQSNSINPYAVMTMKNKNLFTDIKSMMCMNYITNGGVDFFNNYFMDNVR